MWCIATPAREKHTWKDHLVQNTIQSTLCHTAVKVSQEDFDKRLVSLRSKFLDSLLTGDTDPLLGDNNPKLPHAKRFWLLPCIMLSLADAEHAHHRDSIADPAESEMMQQACEAHTQCNTHLDAVIPESFHPHPNGVAGMHDTMCASFSRDT